ncbi:DUF2521 family protein [Calidifontibacillus erzurumensis]|uniref:DUF2521 family protein n=1 Tax=Calidifontibacillus erzurumensis TaxID=2741433 RepID=UPI0035B56607
MNVITTLQEKREAKRIAFERKVLRELSLKQIKEKISYYFSPFFRSHTIFRIAVEDGSVDIAIELYILGATMSRFGFYGETEDQVRARCESEIKYYTDSLLDYLEYWGAIDGNQQTGESMYLAVEQFALYWWTEGFRKGERRYKMRLH